MARTLTRDERRWVNALTVLLSHQPVSLSVILDKNKILKIRDDRTSEEFGIIMTGINVEKSL
jgi:hypothetical protein